MTLFLSRLQIRNDPSVQTLGPLLDPAGPDQRIEAHHRLIWSAFAGDPTAPRDFLWRAEGQGRFMVLSPRPPSDTPFFEPPLVKEFAPDLRAGDRLGFALRANATRTEKTGQLTANGKERKRHIDLVMDTLPPSGQRSEARMKTAQSVAQTWLAGQGARCGFAPAHVSVEDYSVRRLSRSGKRAKPATIGVLDMIGTLTVTDPEPFIAALARGLGRAKAFGCGLMLIRRV